MPLDRGTANLPFVEVAWPRRRDAPVHRVAEGSPGVRGYYVLNAHAAATDELGGADANGTCTYTLSGEEVMQVGPSPAVRELAAALRRERTPMQT